MYKKLIENIPSSIVVFLVALPLCLGIALASGAPLIAGLVSGIVGGIIVGAFSGSTLGVSGPAAGLAVIVLNGIATLDSFNLFLLAVILSGVLQILMGCLGAGIIAYFFPSSVIHGMLAGIGILIIIKQAPHVLGYDNANGSLISNLDSIFGLLHPGVLLVSIISLAVLILWEQPIIKKFAFTKFIQGPLVVVVFGIIFSQVTQSMPTIGITGNYLVSLPIFDSIIGFFNGLARPDFSGLTNFAVYKLAVVLAIVASLETLLCVEATDKQDPKKRITPTNKELRAQGIGNIVAGFIGGLPVTQVIVRSSANQQAGATSRVSTILHGALLLLSVLLIPSILNMIPVSVLATVLIVVGFKLAKPSLFKKMYNEGVSQFMPFIITILGIVFTDLLMGIGMGMAAAIFIILKNNYRVPFNLKEWTDNDLKHIKVTLSEDVSFLNKASVQKLLSRLPNNISVEINASQARFVHRDVVEIIDNFVASAEHRGIKTKVIDLDESKVLSPILHFRLMKGRA